MSLTENMSCRSGNTFIMSPSMETTLSVSCPTARTQGARIMRPCQKFEGHTNAVRHILHLPGGEQIMTCSCDGSLRVWNLQTGRQISVLSNEFASSIALSPSGKKIAIGHWNGLLKLYDVNTGKGVIATCRQFGVRSLCWSGDGRRVMSTISYGPSSFKSVIRVWGLESAKTVLEVETGISSLESTIYSPDMTMIAAGGGKLGLGKARENDTFIEIWDTNTGRLVANLKGHTEAVFCLAWTADGSTLISGSLDGSIRTWDTSTWHQITVFTKTGVIRDIAIHPTAPILASASWDSTARLWNLHNGQPIGPPIQHADNVHCVSFSADGNLLATECWDNNAYTWDILSILRDAGFVLNTNLFLNVDVTQLAGQRHKNSAHRLHPDSFQETPRHPDVCSTEFSSYRYSQPSKSSRILLTSASYKTPSQSRFLAWAKNSFFSRSHRRNDRDRDAELQKHLATAIEVDMAASIREERLTLALHLSTMGMLKRPSSRSFAS